MREFTSFFLSHFYTILFLSFFLMLLNGAFYSVRSRGKLRFSGIGYYIGTILRLPVVSLFKEDIIPDGGSPIVYRIVPYLMVAPILAVFFVFPLNGNDVISHAPLFLVPFMTIIWVICMSFLAIASGNFLSTVEAVRKNYQSLAVIVNMFLPIVSVVILSGTSSLSEIVNSQKGTFYGVLPGFLAFKNPFILIQMIIFFSGILQILGMSPFGGAEIGKDVIAREYHGLRWLWLVLGKRIMFILLTVFGIFLFLGGWISPFESLHLMTGVEWAPFWLNLKIVFLFFCLLYVHYRYPDLSMRKTLYFQWKYGIPLSVLLTLANILWRIAE